MPNNHLKYLTKGLSLWVMWTGQESYTQVSAFDICGHDHEIRALNKGTTYLSSMGSVSYQGVSKSSYKHDVSRYLPTYYGSSEFFIE